MKAPFLLFFSPLFLVCKNMFFLSLSKFQQKYMHLPSPEFKLLIKRRSPFPRNRDRSDLDDFRGSDQRILPCDGLPAGSLVVEAARVPVRVPVLPAEQLAAPAPEPRQPHPLRAPAAPFHLPRRLRRRRIRTRPLRIRSRLLGDGDRGRRRGADGCGRARGRRRRRRRSGGFEAGFAHVIGGGVAVEAAVVDAEGQGFGGLELRLLFFSLSHDFPFGGLGVGFGGDWGI